MLSTIIYVIAIIRRRLKKIGRGVSLIAAGMPKGKKRAGQSWKIMPARDRMNAARAIPHATMGGLRGGL